MNDGIRGGVGGETGERSGRGTRFGMTSRFGTSSRRGDGFDIGFCGACGVHGARDGRTLCGVIGCNGTMGLPIPGTGLPIPGTGLRSMGRSLGLRSMTGPGVKDRKYPMRRIRFVRKSPGNRGV